ncbi:glutathione S-transferase family protein [Variovorax saccharolyticus]|uniref:glutathione S-transferase family protein n=1 Tax=Variovorax saccharolyticus TaxID=3053516 RepID=UPI0025757E4A|nr:glutathione S-transferase family protein [Variovorax sp. J31P216]MDM0026531.1 glutathione S-transferase family protein [Variovorax sp. J31P216]
MSGIDRSAPHLVLHHFPGACSQVCVFALEHAGLPYELRLVDLQSSEQTGDAYVAVSPLGKVPALVIDGVVLTENAAIQTYVAELRPQAGLFPRDGSPLTAGLRQAGLSLCGGTLHPIVRGLANPSRITEGDPEGVRRRSSALATKSFGFAEARIAETGWWFDEWSLVDVYLNWAVSVAASAGFDFAPFPTLAGLRSRLAELPAFRRMLEIEAQANATLALRRAAR